MCPPARIPRLCLEVTRMTLHAAVQFTYLNISEEQVKKYSKYKHLKISSITVD